VVTRNTDKTGAGGEAKKEKKMEKVYLQPTNVPKPAGDYSQGLKVKGGTLVVISGQVAWDVQGNLVGKGDFRAQTRQVFENLKHMLASAGATFKEVVKLGIFLKNREDFAAFREIRAQYLAPPYPPTTLLVVKDLAREEWLLEVEAMAVVEK
jgi:reactive intermediate/imine deaminase